MRHPTYASRRRRGAAIIALLLSGACELDLQNPNSPTEGEVITTSDGVFAAAVGMQGIYAQATEDFVLVPALVTDEWGTQTPALVSYRSLFDGQNFDPSFGVVEAPWFQAYRTIRAANTVLAAAPNVGFSAGLRGGVEAVAELYKAMALGAIIMQYERVPIDFTVPAPTPQPRAIVLDTILALLEDARVKTGAMNADEFTTLRARVLGARFDLRATIHAMRARYYLMDGQYQQAIDAADSVSLTVLSMFTFPSPDLNPLCMLSFSLQYVAGLKSFVDSAEAGDGRPAYWLNTSEAAFRGIPDSLLYRLRRYSTQQDSFPVYLPDEMRLIKAEAYTRLGDYPTAAGLVNEVRTDTVTATRLPAAGLPAMALTDLDTEAELLAQIAYERRYELYMQGLRWEDTRRLGAPLTTTPTFPYLPTPSLECRTNPNAVNCS